MRRPSDYLGEVDHAIARLALADRDRAPDERYVAALRRLLQHFDPLTLWPDEATGSRRPLVRAAAAAAHAGGVLAGAAEAASVLRAESVAAAWNPWCTPSLFDGLPFTPSWDVRVQAHLGAVRAAAVAGPDDRAITERAIARHACAELARLAVAALLRPIVDARSGDLHVAGAIAQARDMLLCERFTRSAAHALAQGVPVSSAALLAEAMRALRGPRDGAAPAPVLEAGFVDFGVACLRAWDRLARHDLERCVEDRLREVEREALRTVGTVDWPRTDDAALATSLTSARRASVRATSTALRALAELSYGRSDRVAAEELENALALAVRNAVAAIALVRRCAV